METSIARFDTRLPKEQKEFFEFAANLGGYRTLTEFVIMSVQSKADEIVEKHRSVLSSKRDQKVFFEAIMNPPTAGKRLNAAARKYNKLTKQK
ncbi:MAG TPA: DUF1778 domain-containing protein [Puia sp.]|jgi:uncharacterized protein (DUF1778 family)|nr:DUF1778 domain-containing protein [Puia sp.]